MELLTYSRVSSIHHNKYTCSDGDGVGEPLDDPEFIQDKWGDGDGYGDGYGDGCGLSRVVRGRCISAAHLLIAMSANSRVVFVGGV